MMLWRLTIWEPDAGLGSPDSPEWMVRKIFYVKNWYSLKREKTLIVLKRYLRDVEKWQREIPDDRLFFGYSYKEEFCRVEIEPIETLD